LAPIIADELEQALETLEGVPGEPLAQRRARRLLMLTELREAVIERIRVDNELRLAILALIERWRAS